MLEVPLLVLVLLAVPLSLEIALHGRNNALVRAAGEIAASRRLKRLFRMFSR